MGLKPFRVLTIDGGGMRGLYSVALLRGLLNLFDRSDLDLGRQFDLICGTSTGAIIGAGLASGTPLHEMQNLFEDAGPKIFPAPIPSSYTKLIPWVFRHLGRPSGDQHALREALKDVIGEQTFEQLWKARGIALCITSTDLASCSPRVFKTPHDPQRTLDRNLTLASACVASAAAPIVFSVAKDRSPQNDKAEWSMADGGLWANNPVLVGVIAALEMAQIDQSIEIVSVGTCLPPGGQVISRATAGRGLAAWLFGIKALDTSLDVSAAGAHNIASFIVKALAQRGTPIMLHRLPQGRLAGEQAVLIGLDQSSSESLSVLYQCADTDSRLVHKEHFDSLHSGGTLLGRILVGV